MTWSGPDGGSELPPDDRPPPAPPPPAAPGAGAAPGSYQYPPPAPEYGGAQAPLPRTGTDGTAIATFVLGLLSVFIFGLILGIIALVLAPKAKRNIEASGGQLGGAGLVTAGRILAIVGIIGWVILIAVRIAS
jgi:hypothetical protein